MSASRHHRLRRCQPPPSRGTPLLSPSAQPSPPPRTAVAVNRHLRLQTSGSSGVGQIRVHRPHGRGGLGWYFSLESSCWRTYRWRRCSSTCDATARASPPPMLSSVSTSSAPTGSRRRRKASS